MTEVEHLSFSYGSRQILKDLSFRLDSGECLVIAGPNGSGKSTLLSLLAGVLRPGSGRIHPGGRLGFVPQGTALFEDMSVKDNIHFFAGASGCPVPAALPFGLDSCMHMRVCNMSGGMKKRLSITCALFGDPQVILLDEPCAALDMEYRQELIRLVETLKKTGHTIVYSGHEPMEFSSFYDRILFLGSHPRFYSREELSGTAADSTVFSDRFWKAFTAASQVQSGR